MNRRLKNNVWMIVAVVIFLSANKALAAAFEEWTSGHHEITQGQTYLEIWLSNDAVADMWGGNVDHLGSLDTSRFNIHTVKPAYLFFHQGNKGCDYQTDTVMN